MKVLPGYVSGDPEFLARFEREAEPASAALSHPNILSIFDFGNEEGIAFAVMELLEGNTLREKLHAGSSQKQAVDYALQIARGLAAAHEKGVVHRDLKPENIFVSKGGHLKILDFGLAKQEDKIAPGEETSAPTLSGHTQPGTVMGTVGYMSPEQVRGLPVDQRSDIFSFGAILYELLSGQRAFRRETLADTAAAILKEEPPELSESGRHISSALDHIVRHCLEKDRDRRFQSARDIEFALEETSSPAATSGARLGAPSIGRKKVLIAVAAIGVLAVGSIVLLRRPPRGGGDAGGVKRVAVLPFENLGPAEDDYFADGVADEVRSKLAAVHGLQVVARASSTPYKKTSKTPVQIAGELQAYLPADRHGAMGPRAQRPEPGSRHLQSSSSFLRIVSAVPALAAAVRRGADRRVPGPIGHRVEGRARPRCRTRGRRRETDLRETDAKNLAAYDAFLKGEEAWNREWPSPNPSEPAEGVGPLRAGRGHWTPPSRKRGRGSRSPPRPSTETARRHPRSPSEPAWLPRSPWSLRRTGRKDTGPSEVLLAAPGPPRPQPRDGAIRKGPAARADKRQPARVDRCPSNRSMGLWDAALEHGEAGRADLDPRSVTTKRPAR